MDSRAFVQQLAAQNQGILNRLKEQPEPPPCGNPKEAVIRMLKIALKNEMEAFELSARWIESTPEPDVKVGFARQVGDEAKHYRLIEERIKELGGDLAGFNPIAQGYSPLFQYLSALKGTVERAAAAQFTRESIAVVKNEQFIGYLTQLGDKETARLYREIVQPDEKYHHELGRTILEKYATSPESQEAARAASERTLELAEELQGLALQKMGISKAPGC